MPHFFEAELPSTGEAVMKFAADASDPTSGGGAATGRVAVDIGGNIKYLAYYG